MIVKFHPYRPNGLGAIDENGHVRCWCGFLKEQHQSGSALSRTADDPPNLPVGPD